jgi:hypothetical protein
MADRLLDRLQPANAPGLPQGLYTNQQRVCEQIEALFAAIQGQVTDLAAIVADIQAAQDAADAAQATAASAAATASTASTTANNVKDNDALSSSYTAPGTVLSAADAGSDATITIAAHSRVYGDQSSVSVNSGSLTGCAYSTTYYVYYTQTSRAGGAVSYQKTTNVNTALPNKAAGRHYVGSVTTPASGGGATSGGTNAPAGGGTFTRDEINSTL